MNFNAEDKAKLDIVIPVFNEEESIFNNILHIKNVVENLNIFARFIIVNDGSSDNTWLEIKRLKQQIPNLIGIDLSRNFGKESALCAGLSEVCSDLCLVMDSDLQHPPELIQQMLEKQKQGFNIVEGIKENRGKESVFYKLSTSIFYRFLDKISGFSMKNSSDFKLFDKEVLEAWKTVGDTNTFFRGMIEWVGFKKAEIGFSVAERKGGKSKFSTVKLMRLAFDAITSFSAAPLYLTNLLSFVFFVCGVVLGVQTLYNKLSGKSLDGFSTVILLLLIIGSAILFCLGIIGTYISRIYDEVKNRPRFIVKEKI